jgi:DNA-directed RNA polymerase specialized sigma24 family protein
MSVNDDAARRFDALFAAHYADVLGYVVRRAPLANAEDVLAETFLVACRRADQVPDDALPWLLGVARRVLSNQRRGDLRRQALRIRLRSTSTAPAMVWEPPSGVCPELAGALASLSEHEREALLLTAWDGLDLNRAAKAAGCSAAAFRVRLHRARKRVAAQLGDSITSSSAFSRASKETG